MAEPKQDAPGGEGDDETDNPAQTTRQDGTPAARGSPAPRLGTQAIRLADARPLPPRLPDPAAHLHVARMPPPSGSPARPTASPGEGLPYEPLGFWPAGGGELQQPEKGGQT